MKINNIKFVNVYNDSFALYEYCILEGYTTETFEDWMDNGGDLSFFEGDPDMFKIRGKIGYFAFCPRVNTVFYYMDDYDRDPEGVLKGFFNSCHKVNGGYYTTERSNRQAPEHLQNREAWERMQNGIAHRGGCGYIYNIYPLRFKSGWNA